MGEVPSRRSGSPLARQVLAPLLASRALAGVFAGTCALVLALQGFHVPAWRCPLAALASFPCPGCGLGRSILATARGDWARALSMHAFGPIALAALVLVALAAVLPAAPRDGLASLVRAGERRGLSALFLFALVGYWLARIVLGIALVP